MISVTEVEVTFTAIDGDSTTVQLTHLHWQRLGDVAAATRANYSQGWVGVLSGYTGKAKS